MVKVEVEYCTVCNFEGQCKDLKELLQVIPNTMIECTSGRQGAFEIKIDGTLVYSKLQTMAFPDYDSIAENVKNVHDGKPLTKIIEQPINNCVLQ